MACRSAYADGFSGETAQQGQPQQDPLQELLNAVQQAKQSGDAEAVARASQAVVDVLLRAMSARNVSGEVPPASDEEKELRALLAQAFSDLGTSEAIRKNYGAALGHFEDAEHWDAELPGLTRSLGIAAYRAERYPEAVRGLTAAVEAGPADTTARALLGMAYFAEERFMEAAKTFEPLGLNGMRDAVVGYAWADSLASVGEMQHAAEVLGEFEKVERPSETLLLVGQVWIAIGNYQRAVASFQRALELTPALARGHYDAGLAYVKWERWPEAAREFKAELVVNPGDADAKYNLGFVYVQQGKRTAAEALFKEVLAAHPDYVNAEYELGKLYRERGSRKQAEALRLSAQLSTPDHLADEEFWPTKQNIARSEYVGPKVCASCHKNIAESQTRTSMAQTAHRADSVDILHGLPRLTFQAGQYHYEIFREDMKNVYKISGEGNSLEAMLTWAFGTGRVGQSYLFRAPDDSYREAKVTYFSSIHNLGFTPARAFAHAKDIDEAMYRPVTKTEAGRCFACHATASMVGNEVEESGLFPGVTCEACHGPGARHVAAMEPTMLEGAPVTGPEYILNPASLEPLDSVDFCGACHVSSRDVALTGTKGIVNARSQPYRLELSKCWGAGDARLRCMSCHDPHQEVDAVAENYDHVCASCHMTGSNTRSATVHEKPCPVGTSGCVNCHMPKVFLPEIHSTFTDHKIRISRAGEGYVE